MPQPALTAPARASRRALASLALALLAALPLACGRDAPAAAAPASTASPATTASSGPASASPAPEGAPPAATAPDPARAFRHLEALAGDIGVRAATTDGERRAAEYIRAQLEAAGYRASLEPFEVNVTLRGTARLTLPDGAAIEAVPLSGSGAGSATGPLFPAGLGRADYYPRAEEAAGRSARGTIVSIVRGEITFAEKVRVAQAQGASAVIIANNQPGLYSGSLGDDPVTIPVLAVAQESIAALARAGSATVSVETQQLRGTSYNVVGQPSAAPCTAYLGAHYDSVPAGPGANDNASGTALLLELARARRAAGVCVIAFGAEEVGLLGSRAYVRAHPIAGARFMLNFDMVAKITRPFFLGDPSLTALAGDAAAARGLDIRAGSFGPGTSSDHATFAAAGVPVLMLYSGDDEFIHTARDNVANVSAEHLGTYLALATGVLDTLLAR
jgi:aminopeptidase YwaD